MALGALLMFAHPVRLLAHPHGPFEIVTHEHPALGLIISIEDERVVYDISISNGFLNTLIPQERGHLKLRLEENTFIFEDADQEEAERRSLEAYFLHLAPINIDGASVEPHVDSFQYVRSSASADKSVSETLPPDARVRVTFPATKPPQQVELVWNVFTDAYSVDAFGDPVKPSLAARLDTHSQSRIITFTKRESSVTWTAPKAPADMSIAVISQNAADSAGGIPILSIAVGAAALVACFFCRNFRKPWRARAVIVVFGLLVAIPLRDVGRYAGSEPKVDESSAPFPETAGTIFTSLLKNIYRAFDYRNESDIYDVLAQSVDGPLLDAIYKEIHGGLVSAEQGGAVAKVKNVEIMNLALVDPAQAAGEPFEIKGQWRVDGMVYHWGHVHDTSSIVKANYTVAPRDGFWKIVRTEMKSTDPDV